MAAFDHVAEKRALGALKGEILAQGYRAGCSSHEKLGDKIGRSGATITNWMKDPKCIKLGDMRNMVRLLKLDPLVVLEALGYTRADIKNMYKGEMRHERKGEVPGSEER